QPLTPVLVSNNSYTYCDGDNILDLVAEVSATDPVGGTVTWYSNVGLTNVIGSGDSLSPNTNIGSTTYYAAVDNNGCKGGSVSASITINPLPSSPTAVSDIQICDGENMPNLTVVGTGPSYTWYDDAALTNQVGTGDTISTPLSSIGSATYYGTQTNVGGCTSAPDSVSVTLDSIPSVPMSPLA